MVCEKVIYSAEDGQLLTGSYMDYGIPRADNLAPIDVEFFEQAPSQKNPLGVKGSGEAGCCGALAATVNAVMDALSSQGIEHVDMPLTPHRIWQALSGSQAGL
jgi:carbon-monoxide dehydrogenase large subunit